IRDLDRCGTGIRELDAGTTCCIEEPFARYCIVRKIEAFFRRELRHEMVADAGIEVVAAELIDAGRRQHREGSARTGENRYVEGTAAEIVDQYRLAAIAGRRVLPKRAAIAAGWSAADTVGERARRRFADDAEDVETGERACLLRRLTLGVVEVCRSRDDRGRHFATEVLFGIAF